MTIRASKWFYLLVLIVCAAALIAAFWPVWSTWPALLRTSGVMAWMWMVVLLVILGVPLVTFIISILKGLPLIVLDANGIAFEALVVSLRRPWSEVERFTPRVIYVGFSDLSQPRGFWDRLNRFGSRGRRMLFNMFELRPKELAQLLAAWRERALAQPQAGDRPPYGSSSVSQ